MHQVFVSWSGGKDSCLACYRATADGMKVRYLANTVSEDGKRSFSHGLSAGVIKVQSQAMGIPLVQRRTNQNNYEAEFKNMLRAFKQEGIEGGVFGDIDFEEHRQWVERVCQDVAVTPHLPLWGENQNKVLKDFIDAGFESVIIATKADMIGEEWLGRRLDTDFISYLDELKKTKDVTPCGEAGEYHTLVVDGPLFKKRIEILESKKVLRNERWFLEISGTELRDK
ncbi:MAG TPA: diphthine--ammonia ligase [Dehalococcoidales bacterium]|nr:diphthine--ammonia ligase [Dehalococcoidales bacterium]